jgi:hypothetical protein
MYLWGRNKRENIKNVQIVNANESVVVVVVVVVIKAWTVFWKAMTTRQISDEKLWIEICFVRMNEWCVIVVKQQFICQSPWYSRLEIALSILFHWHFQFSLQKYRSKWTT